MIKRLVTSDSIYIGRFEDSIGQLGIEGGGIVTSRIGRIGYASGAEGIVTVSGSESLGMISEDLLLSRNETNQQTGPGLLNVLNGGRVEVADWIRIGDQGLIRLDGDRL